MLSQIGAFFMINLCLVVIATQFSETKKRETERMRLERARFQSTSTLGSSLENAGCYAEILRYVAHLWRRLRRRLRSRWRQMRHKPPTRFSLRRRRHREGGHHHRSAHEGARDGARDFCADDPESGRDNNNFCCDNKVDEWAPRASPEVSDVDALSTPRRPDCDAAAVGMLVPVGSVELDSSDCERGLDSQLAPPGILCSRLTPDAGRPPERRAKSVSYDVNKPVIIPIQRLGAAAAAGETAAELASPQLRAELSRAESQLRKLRSSVFPRVCRSADRGPLSCTELLAISGALSAALPAQLAQVPVRSPGQQLPPALAGVAGVAGVSGVAGGPTTTRPFSEPVLPLGPGSPPIDSPHSASDASWSGDSEESCSSSSSEDYSCDEEDEEYWSEYDEEDHRPPRCPRLRAVIHWFRSGVKGFIDHSYTQKAILLAIMINTLSMGVEYHNQPPWLTTLVETSNIVFSAVFALEMLLKLIADGFYGYIRNGFNVFDGVIVIIRWVSAELAARCAAPGVAYRLFSRSFYVLLSRLLFGDVCFLETCVCQGPYAVLLSGVRWVEIAC